MLPDPTGLLSYMLHIFTGVMRGLVVYPERMRRNLELTQGLIFSSKVLLALIESGLTREAAYVIVQRHSMTAGPQETPLPEPPQGDPDVSGAPRPAEPDGGLGCRAFPRRVPARSGSGRSGGDAWLGHAPPSRHAFSGGGPAIC